MKYALVTGGSGGIGRAVCKRLARDGHHVLIHAFNNIDSANAIASEITAEGGRASSIQCDLTDNEATENVFAPLVEANPIQILVHNAGIHSDAPLAGMSYEQWHKVVQVSLDGFFNVTRPLLLPMMATRWGRIIAMSSIAGVMGNRGQANYAAAKSGLHGACKSLAIEVASRGITVNAIAPGVIETSMSSESFPEQWIKQHIPMKRAGQAEEVASLVSFLTGEESAYISGQIIGINGAMA